MWRPGTEQEQITHALLGLAGEAGEVVDLYKKLWFTPSRVRENFEEELLLELGDVLYYLDRIAEANGFDLADIMEANINKLEKRYGSQ